MEARAMTWFRISTAQGNCLIPVLLPHLFFKTLHGEKQKLFMFSIMGGYENLEFFWASETWRILLEDHPVLRDRDRRDLANTVPIGVHGDGAEFSHQDSIYVVSWNSPIGLGRGPNGLCFQC